MMGDQGPGSGGPATYGGQGFYTNGQRLPLGVESGLLKHVQHSGVDGSEGLIGQLVQEPGRLKEAVPDQQIGGFYGFPLGTDELVAHAVQLGVEIDPRLTKVGLTRMYETVLGISAFGPDMGQGRRLATWVLTDEGDYLRGVRREVIPGPFSGYVPLEHLDGSSESSGARYWEEFGRREGNFVVTDTTIPASGSTPEKQRPTVTDILVEGFRR
jgi:hypothetical protein